MPSQALERALSPAEAAQLCGVSIDTIRRRLRDGSLDGAYRDGEHEWSRWLIPASELTRVGLCDEATVRDADAHLDPDAQRLVAQLAEARAELVAEQARCRAAEERLSQALGEVDHLRSIVDRLLVQSAPAKQVA
jgi:excisionase family DNA binding protein